MIGRVVLVAHGSRREGAEAPLHAIAQALVDGGVCAVADVVTRPFSHRRDVVDRGAADVVVPMFFTLTDDNRDSLQATWPGAVIAEPIGTHPLIAAVIAARALEAEPTAKGPIVVVGHGSSRATAQALEKARMTRLEEPCASAACVPPTVLPPLGGASGATRDVLLDEVRRWLPDREVRVAFLEVQSPSIPAALDALDADDDDSDVVVVPAFFLHGQHTVVDIPALLLGRRRRALLALPLLDQPLLVDAVGDRVMTAAARLER